MANVLICYPNRADEVTLSGGAWSAGLPRANLQTKDIKRYARTTNALTTSTQFVASFPASRAIRMVSLVNTNLSRDASCRIRWATDAGFTDVVYDSGTVQMYADGIVPFGSIDWEEEGFWDGRLSTEQISWYPRDLIHVMDGNKWGRYLKVELFDTTNAAGYVQAGRLFVGKGFQPEWNISYGRQITHSSGTGVSETLARREIFDPKPLVRTETVDLDWLSEDEGITLFDLERQLDISSELFYAYDYANQVTRMRWSFLGRLEKPSALTHPMFGIHKKQLALKEII